MKDIVTIQELPGRMDALILQDSYHSRLIEVNYNDHSVAVTVKKNIFSYTRKGRRRDIDTAERRRFPYKKGTVDFAQVRAFVDPLMADAIPGLKAYDEKQAAEQAAVQAAEQNLAFILGPKNQPSEWRFSAGGQYNMYAPLQCEAAAVATARLMSGPNKPSLQITMQVRDPVMFLTLRDQVFRLVDAACGKGVPDEG